MAQPQNSPSQNTAWGFYGTISSHADPDEAWPLAMTAIGTTTGCPGEAVRDFPDSRHGRHFADEVANDLLVKPALKPAIDAAVERWMGWRISRQTHRQHGIPSDLPYLTGYVTYFEIEAETV